MLQLDLRPSQQLLATSCPTAGPLTLVMLNQSGHGWQKSPGTKSSSHAGTLVDNEVPRRMMQDQDKIPILNWHFVSQHVISSVFMAWIDRLILDDLVNHCTQHADLPLRGLLHVDGKDGSVYTRIDGCSYNCSLAGLSGGQLATQFVQCQTLQTTSCSLTSIHLCVGKPSLLSCLPKRKPCDVAYLKEMCVPTAMSQVIADCLPDKVLS